MKNMTNKELIDKIRGEVPKFKGASSYYDSPETKEVFRRLEEGEKAKTEIDRLNKELEEASSVIEMFRLRAEKAEARLKELEPQMDCSCSYCVQSRLLNNYTDRKGTKP